MDVPAEPTGQTLHEALPAYAQRALRVGTEHARTEAARAERIKLTTPDRDLAELGSTAMEQIRDHWCRRPPARLANGKSSDRPISVHPVESQTKRGHANVVVVI